MENGGADVSRVTTGGKTDDGDGGSGGGEKRCSPHALTPGRRDRDHRRRRSCSGNRRFVLGAVKRLGRESPRHWARNASAGSIRAARSAGIQHAPTPTSAIVTSTAAIVTGSCGGTPNRSP